MAVSSPPHVLIVGGSYAGISALNTLITGSAGISKEAPAGARPGPPGPPSPARALGTRPRYTILDERDGYYHTVGAPLGQVDPGYANQFWVPFSGIVKDKAAVNGDDIRFVQGSAASLDPEAKKLTYTTAEKEEGSIAYDFVLVATGMRRGAPIVPQALHERQHLQDVEDFVAPLRTASRIVFVGGGAVGIEMASEAKIHFPQAEVVLIHSRSQLLSNEPLPDDFKAKALEILQSQGVRVLLNTRVLSDERSSNTTNLQLSNNESLPCDRVIYSAQQQGANTNFLSSSSSSSSSLFDSQGCVKIQPSLQFPSPFPNSAYHYAVGDATSWPQIKRSGPAQNQGKYAATNILNALIALEDGKQAQDAEKAELPLHTTATMTLAIGNEAVTLKGGALRFGPQVKKGAFGDSLGFEGTVKKLDIRPKRMASPGLEREQIVLSANM